MSCTTQPAPPPRSTTLCTNWQVAPRLGVFEQLKQQVQDGGRKSKKHLLCLKLLIDWRAQTLKSYLSSGLDSLPNAEEADDPDHQQTQRQVPFHRTQVVDAGADGQHVISATAKKARGGQGRTAGPDRVQNPPGTGLDRRSTERFRVIEDSCWVFFCK